MPSQTTRVIETAEANGWDVSIKPIPVKTRGAKWPEDFHQPSHVATFTRGDQEEVMVMTPHARFAEASTAAKNPLTAAKVDDWRMVRGNRRLGFTSQGALLPKLIEALETPAAKPKRARRSRAKKAAAKS